MSKLTCPQCLGTRIVRNGKKANGSQNYLCKDCKKQFISDSERTYKGTITGITDLIKRAMVRGSGIRDIAFVFMISIGKILKTLAESSYDIMPKKQHYSCLEIDELWTFVGSKNNKKWLLYAYDRQSGEIVAFVWGSRNTKTAKALRKKLIDLEITYDCIATDDWVSFKKAFAKDNHIIGKEHTVGIEGNNCRIRHRMRRAFRKTCNFSKNETNHNKAFEMTVHYINFEVV